MSAPRLEVLIAAYEQAGIERIAAAPHPEMEGVEYTVCWQLPNGGGRVPETLSRRGDFRIIRLSSVGSGRCRMEAMEHCRCELVLIGDDDLYYTEEGLAGVIEAFDRRPDCDVLTFRYSSDIPPAHHPDYEFDWRRAPRGCYPTCFEIAFRREKVQGRATFNPHFGVNSDFIAGEEDIFFNDLLCLGLTAHYVSHTICFHPGLTTAYRKEPMLLIQAKGAVFTEIRPKSWLPRMIIHALRSRRPMWYCRQWLRGVKKWQKIKDQ